MFLDMHIWAMFSQPPPPRLSQSQSAEGGWVLPQNRFRSACLHLVSNTPHFNSHFLLLLPFRTTVLFLFLLLLFSNLSMHMFDHFLFSHFPSQVPRLDCIFSRAFSQLTLLHFLCFQVSFLTSLLKWNILTISSLATFLHYHPCLLFFFSFLSLHVLSAFTSLFSRHSLLFSALVSSLSVLLFLFSIFSFTFFNTFTSSLSFVSLLFSVIVFSLLLLLLLFSICTASLSLLWLISSLSLGSHALRSAGSGFGGTDTGGGGGRSGACSEGRFAGATAAFCEVWSVVSSVFCAVVSRKKKSIEQI